MSEIALQSTQNKGANLVRRHFLVTFLNRSQAFWFFLDGILAFVLCSLFGQLSPYETFGVVRTESLQSSLIFSGLFSVISVGTGLFERRYRFQRNKFIPAAVIACVAAFGGTLATMNFLFFAQVGRLHLLFGSLAALVGVLAVHALIARVVSRSPYRFLFVGDSTPISKRIHEFFSIEKNSRHFRSAGQWDNGLVLKKIQELGPEALIQEIHALDIHEIVLTARAQESPVLIEFSLAALKEGVRVVEEFTTCKEVFESIPVEQIDTRWLLAAGIGTPRGLSYVAKRAFDYLIAGTLLVLFAPLLLLIALFVKLTSPGPIFYVQQRQGLFCRPFNILKFRTMHGSESGPTSTTKRDQRVTWLGKILRPLHLDELPQLWNVLRGEMSLVGPRPEALEFARRIKNEVPVYEFRHVIPPGLTGLSQIRLGYTGETISDTQRKLAYDLYYILNFNLFMDFMILWRTVFVLTRGSR